MSKKPIDVVTVGESMVLFQPMSDGPLQYSPLFSRSIAGAESNLAIALSRLGLSVRYISRLGTDPFGDLILATLAGEGVDTSLVVRDQAAPTAVYFKEFKGYGDPNVYYYRKNSAASLLCTDDLEDSWFDGARHLHVTGITPALGAGTTQFVVAAMQRAKAANLTISFDPNLRRKLWPEELARSTLLSLVPLADVFLPGIEEAEFLLGPMSVDEYAKAFLDMGPRVVCIKLGAEGSVAYTRSGRFEGKPYAVDRIVDTVGAGDAFAAGFLSALLTVEGTWSDDTLLEVLPKALSRANLLGALATQWKGDWEGSPRLDEVNRLLAGQSGVTR